MSINASTCNQKDGELAGDQSPHHSPPMFNTNSIFLNRFQSYFQAPRRRRFQTNRFNKAERLDNTRGEQNGQEANEFESRAQTSFNSRLNGEARFEADSTQWAKVGRRQPSAAKSWSRSLKSIGLDRDPIGFESTGNTDFKKSDKASKTLGQDFEEANRQEQRDPFKSNVLMHSKSNGIETETEGGVFPELSRGIIDDRVAWRQESSNGITQAAIGRNNPQTNLIRREHYFDRNLNLDSVFGIQRIFDASGDASKKEVFEDGALEISYNKTYLNNLINNQAPEINLWGGISFNLPGSVSATVSATKSSTGEVVDLGSTTLNLDQSSFYVNLKDQLEASDSLLDRRSIWNIDVDIDANYVNGLNINLEDFNENITMIDALDVGSGYRGDVTANTFTYNNISWGDSYDTGRIYRGRGGTDTLVLDGINKNDILEFNGSSVNQLGQSAAGGAALGEQAFYGGTVFDVLNLNNGDELYLQGIETISCEDGDIRVRANMSDSTKEQWNLQAMDVSGAWRFNRGSSDVVMVSLDSGIGDIAGNADDIDDEIDHVVNKTSKNTEANTAFRDHGHHSMSIMGARHDSQGIAGIAPGSQMWAYQVWDPGFHGAIEDAKADRESHERLVFQNGAHWIGEGLWGPSGNTDSITEEQMMESLAETEDYGFFSVAAGNESSRDGVNTHNLAHFQTDFGNIASVGAVQFTATDEIDNITNVTGTQIAGYSNQGDDLTLSAPTDSRAVNGNGDITDFPGTSCANPNVAGVAALVWSENTCLSGSDVRDLLTHSAMDLGAAGRDDAFGHGMVNAEAAVRRSHALAENYELASFYTNDQFLA
ncbi:S8 family serine peptidase [Synechococcus sp. MIT S9504]|uniref:S8 family peptidase n=1 Tax=Synechococcus sp. MIT S9504 TaxID=1801628 RepID=UPI00082AD260